MIEQLLAGFLSRSKFTLKSIPQPIVKYAILFIKMHSKPN